MPMVKRTFSIPDEISANLDKTIPNQERSKFISMTLAVALKKRSRDKLIEAIDNIETWEPQEESAVDIIRRIRAQNTIQTTG